MRVPLRSRSVRRQSSRGMQSLRRGRTRAGELVEEAVPLVDRGRDVAESLARGAAEHVPSRRRSRRRRRGVIAVVLLAVGAGVALYLAWQRRDNEPARLVFEPAGPDVAPPPMPEPPQPPVEEVQADPVMAVNTDVTEGAPESVPEAEPVSARAEIEIPLAVAPGVDSVEDELDNVAMAEELSELAVDLDGAFYLAHAATQRLLRHRKRGRVVFIGSWAAHTVQRHIPAYCVSKAGLRMLCKCMAAELSPRGILVNEVAPGYVDAGVSRKYFEEHPGSRERALKTVPVLKLIKPEEVAEQVAYLCEPTNRHVTGTTLLLDGGLSLFGPGGRRDA